MKSVLIFALLLGFAAGAQKRQDPAIVYNRFLDTVISRYMNGFIGSLNSNPTKKDEIFSACAVQQQNQQLAANKF